MNKVIVSLLIAVCATVSQASYLYWQVDASDYPGADFDKAVVKYFDTSTGNIDGATTSATSRRIADYDAVTGVTYDTTGTKGYTYTVDLSTIANADTYSYYIELQNSTGGFVARSNAAVSYSDLAAYISNTDLAFATVAPAATVWHGSPYTAVPEPTSAMLMLFGAAFLGLKRKNRRIA